MAPSLSLMQWTAVPDGSLVIVPLGSTEQHGPHLPLGTDTTIAVAVATALAEQLRAEPSSGQVLVAAPIHYGASGEHQSFPGTSSIGHEALGVLLTELVRSLSTWAASILIVNGHGGNISSLAVTVPTLVGEGHDVAWLPCASPGGDAHAGRTETSIMLHLEPASVVLAEARPGTLAPLRELLPSLRAGGVAAVSPTGVLGDPTGASAEEGEALMGEMVASARRRAAAWQRDGHGCLADPLPPNLAAGAR